MNYALIVDPFSSGALYAAELTKRDITPLAILSHYPIIDGYKASFREKDFAKIFILKDDIMQLFNEINLFILDKKIKFCLPGTEVGVLLADKLSTLFCLKNNNAALTLARTNKYWMAKQLSQAGIQLPLTHRVGSAKEAIEWAKKHNLLHAGVVIKPLDSAATDGVNLCFNANEISQAVNAIIGKKNKLLRFNEYVLVQEFLLGEEYVVDTVSRDGLHMVTNLCKYTKTAINGSRFVYDFLDFLPADGEKQRCLMEYCYRVLDGLGIQYGPAHAEIMLTKMGPRLIEVGSRLHGGIAIHAARLATNNSQLDLTLDVFSDVIFHEKIELFKLKKQVKIVFLISRTSGVITQPSHELEAIKKLPSFVLMKAELEKGNRIDKTVDLFTSPGLILLAHEDGAQVEKDYQAVRSLEEALISSLVGI